MIKYLFEKRHIILLIDNHSPWQICTPTREHLYGWFVGRNIIFFACCIITITIFIAVLHVTTVTDRAWKLMGGAVSVGVFFYLMFDLSSQLLFLLKWERHAHSCWKKNKTKLPKCGKLNYRKLTGQWKLVTEATIENGVRGFSARKNTPRRKNE